MYFFIGTLNIFTKSGFSLGQAVSRFRISFFFQKSSSRKSPAKKINYLFVNKYFRQNLLDFNFKQDINSYFQFLYYCCPLQNIVFCQFIFGLYILFSFSNREKKFISIFLLHLQIRIHFKFDRAVQWQIMIILLKQKFYNLATRSFCVETVYTARNQHTIFVDYGMIK